MEELKENIDYVVCQVCGFKGKRITHKHLFNLHNLTLQQYKEKFPGFKTTSDKSKELTNWSQDVRDRISKTMTGRKLSSEHIEHLKGRPCSPELRKKISDAQIGKYVSEETKQKIRIARAKQVMPKGKVISEDTRKKISIAHNNKYLNGFVHPNKGKKYSSDRKKQISLSLKKLYISGYVSPNKGRKLSEEQRQHRLSKHIIVSEETKQKIRVGHLGKKLSKEHKYKIGLASTGRRHSKETIEKQRAIQKKLANSPERIQQRKEMLNTKEYWEKLQAGLKLRPNKFEQKIAKLIPQAFQYTGDFNPNGMFHFLDGRNKNADFTLFPDRTAVIECFGDYWHGRDIQEIDPKEHEYDVVDNYSKIGVTCLVIWERELNDIPALQFKIQRFLNYVFENSKENL